MAFETRRPGSEIDHRKREARRDLGASELLGNIVVLCCQYDLNIVEPLLIVIINTGEKKVRDARSAVSLIFACVLLFFFFSESTAYYSVRFWIKQKKETKWKRSTMSDDDFFSKILMMKGQELREREREVVNRWLKRRREKFS